MKVAQLTASKSDDEWIVEGYATVFGNVNCYDFCIAKGAYAELIEKGVTPPMFFNHDSFDLPIGKWTKLEEDDVGLKVTGVLTKGLSRASDVYAALKAGTIDGLSVGFMYDPQDVTVLDDDIISINKISDLVEISVCTFPADRKARVSEVLSADQIDEKIETLQSLRDLEGFFKELGLSKRQAGCLTHKAKVAVACAVQRDAEAKEREALSDALNELKSVF